MSVEGGKDMANDVKRSGARDLKAQLHDGGEISLPAASCAALFGYTNVAILEAGIAGREIC